jgi:hypothetical protein
MNKVRSQMNKAKKAGMSSVDLLRIRETAKKEAQRMEKQATERAFLYMLAIPLNVLFNDYWEKTAKRKAPKFIEEVIKLYEAVQDGVVSEQQLAELLDDLAGVKIEAEWMKGNEKDE